MSGCVWRTGESVRVALGELEQFTQARIGNVHKPETTGKFVAATFEHDTARPVDGYAAPQLHTHAVIFNVTERESGPGKLTRSVQSHELYAIQKYVTAVYRSELATRLQGLGYQLERGEYGQPEIKGYTREYLEASSLRREQIHDYKREQGLDGNGAAQIAAHRTRDRKELLSPEEVLQRHRDLAAQYGHQADHVVSQALAQAKAQAHLQTKEQGQTHPTAIDKAAQQAVTYARDRFFERGAVHARKDILAAALDRSMGQATSSQVREEFKRRVQKGEFRLVENVGTGPHYTTAAMLRRDLTGADRTWAERYNVGDVLRYSRGSKETGIDKGEYAQVKSVDASNNRLTVQLQDGTQRTYDPRRQQGVSVYREQERAFSAGDRVQFTAPAQDLKVANRELGTVTSIGEDGRLSLRMDGGREIELDPRQHPHLDHGYAVTSHSARARLLIAY